jgi:hypothetical protein
LRALVSGTSLTTSSLARPLLGGGWAFVMLAVRERGFLAGGGTFSDFLLGGAVRVRLGAGPSSLAGEAARLRAGWLRGFATGFSAAFCGATLEAGFAEAERDERLGGILCAEGEVLGEDFGRGCAGECGGEKKKGLWMINHRSPPGKLPSREHRVVVLCLILGARTALNRFSCPFRIH